MRIAPLPDRLRRLLRSNAAVFLLYALLALPFLLLQDKTILHSDDWFFLRSMVDGSMQGCDPGRGRFLFPSYWKLMYAVFGAHLSGQYITLWFMQVVFAFCIHLTIRILHPRMAGAAVLAGLVVLLAPGDQSREWWTMGHPWLGFGVCFGGALVLLAWHARHRNALALIGCGALFFASFGLYEVHLGLTILVLLIAGWHQFRTDRRWPVGVSAIGLSLGALYAVRYLLYYTPSRVLQPNAEVPSLSPAILLARLEKALTLVVKFWSGPLYAHLPVSSVLAVALTIALTMLAFVIGAGIARRMHRNGSSGMDASADVPAAGRTMLVLACAAAISLFPIILVVPPSGYDIHARTLMATSPAVALLIGAILHHAARRIARTGREAVVITFSAMVPLLLLGATERIDRLHVHAETWAKQRRMWTALLDHVPQLTDSSYVLVLVDNDLRDRRPGYRCLCGAPYDCIDGGVQLLYGRPSLRANAISTLMYDAAGTCDADRGVFNKPRGVAIHRLVCVAFDRADDAFHIVTREELEHRWNCCLPMYDPYSRIDVQHGRPHQWDRLIM